MKLFKTFGLTAIAALMAMAFIGAGSAMAGSTALCNSDPGTGNSEACASSHLISHVHEETLVGSKAKLLSVISTIECDVLFLGDVETSGLLGVSLRIEGNFTYTNCNNNCDLLEANGPATFRVLKSGHERADAMLHFLLLLECGVLINCIYRGVSLEGPAKGPLLSTETNGSVSFIGQELTNEDSVCPDEMFLDITTTPLSATYITK